MKTVVAHIHRLVQQRPLFSCALALVPLVLLAALLGFQLGQGSTPGMAALPTTALPSRSSATAADVARTPERDSMRQPRKVAEGGESPPFWLSAVAPDPAKPRLPTATLAPGSPSPPDVALRTAARVRELEAAAATAENAQQLNNEVILWYDQDPQQATEWLNTTGRFGELASSLASIAAALGERGHLDIARQVLENIGDETTRRRAALDVYTLQARTGKVSREALAAAGWTQADIELVFQGD